MPTYEVQVNGQTFEIEAPDDNSVQLAVRQLQNESKEVQLATRDVARNIMEETKKHASPMEKEKEFQYEKFLDKLKNPKKYEVKCPVCKVCPAFAPVPLAEPQMTQAQAPTLPQKTEKPAEKLPEKTPEKQVEKPKPEIIIEDKPKPVKKEDLEKQAELHIEKSELKPLKKEEKPVEKPTEKTIEEGKNMEKLITPEPEKTLETIKPAEKLPEKTPEKPDEMLSQNSSLAGKLREIEKQTGDGKLDEKIEPLALPNKEDAKASLKKGLDKIEKKVDTSKYKLEKLDINFENLDAITLPD